MLIGVYCSVIGRILFFQQLKYLIGHQITKHLHYIEWKRKPQGATRGFSALFCYYPTEKKDNIINNNISYVKEIINKLCIDEKQLTGVVFFFFCRTRLTDMSRTL